MTETFNLEAVLAKAKTLIAFDEFEPAATSFHQGDQNGTTSINAQSSSQSFNQQQSNTLSTTVSYQFMKQYFNSDQREGLANNHTNDFKKFRDNSIGRYVVQTNKLLITLDKLISIDDDMFTDDSKREGNLYVLKIHF